MHRIALRNSARVTALASKAAAPKVSILTTAVSPTLLAFSDVFLGNTERRRLRHCFTLICNSKAWWVFVFSTSRVPCYLTCRLLLFGSVILRVISIWLTPPPAASEVSSILESRISGSSLGGDVQETGRVLTIGDGMLPVIFSPCLMTMHFLFRQVSLVSTVFGMCKVYIFISAFLLLY